MQIPVAFHLLNFRPKYCNSSSNAFENIFLEEVRNQRSIRINRYASKVSLYSLPRMIIKFVHMSLIAAEDVRCTRTFIGLEESRENASKECRRRGT